MSDSTMSPVMTSTVKLVDPSTRSSCGRFSKPRTVRLLLSSGPTWVKPANCDESETPGTAAHVENAVAIVCCSCCDVTSATLRSVTK